MKYADLKPEIQDLLKLHKFVGVRYSSLASEPNNKVDDAKLFTKGSPIDLDQMSGYTLSTMPEVWFDFVAEGKSDNEAERMALHALMDVAPEFAEPRIKELEA